VPRRVVAEMLPPIEAGDVRKAKRSEVSFDAEKKGQCAPRGDWWGAKCALNLEGVVLQVAKPFERLARMWERANAKLAAFRAPCCASLGKCCGGNGSGCRSR